MRWTRSGLPANRLELEITEGTLMEDPKRADVISLLRERGVRIALDDFGTGYSGLGYLQKFRIDKLKIDRSFIARLGEAEDATIIVRTIVGLAHNLGLAVTAEGVETPEQLAMVREFMCEEVQGFLLGRPLPMGAPSQLSSARARPTSGASMAPLVDPRSQPRRRLSRRCLSRNAFAGCSPACGILPTRLFALRFASG